MLTFFEIHVQIYLISISLYSAANILTNSCGKGMLFLITNIKKIVFTLIAFVRLSPILYIINTNFISLSIYINTIYLYTKISARERNITRWLRLFKDNEIKIDRVQHFDQWKRFDRNTFGFGCYAFCILIKKSACNNF